VKAELRDEVEPHRDPAYAAGAQAYMKSSMPYLGVRMPDLRHAWRVVLDSHPVASERELHEALRELWDEAEYREERYAALALLERGRSLLPAGITGVAGAFGIGDPVRCTDPEGREVARGLANYSSTQSRLIARRPTVEIENILGFIEEPELIHRDNLVLT